MNRMHIIARIQQCVLDGATDENEVYGKLRKDLPGAVNTGADELMSRAEVQAIAKSVIAQTATAKFPVERARLALDVKEHLLKADILDALATVDVSNPRDCRDVFEVHQRVASSVGEPSAREAIDFLAAADKDVTGLWEQFAALWPVAAEDAA